MATGEQNGIPEIFLEAILPSSKGSIVLGGFAGWGRGLQDFDGLLYNRVRGRAGRRAQILIADLGDVVRYGTDFAGGHNALDRNLFASMGCSRWRP